MAYEDYIIDNLNTLENLSKNDFRYISENIDRFYIEGFSENSQSKLSYLFRLLSYEYLPITFTQSNVRAKIDCGIPCLYNDRKQLCYEENGVLVNTPVLKSVDFKTFTESYKSAYQTHKPTDRWKSNTNKEQFKSADNYVADDGSVVSISNNEIINICKRVGQNSYCGHQLLKSATEHGGKIAESFDSQFNLFVKNGFVPVSICKFDISHAPDSWLKQNGLNKETDMTTIDLTKLTLEPEDIIFYIYIGEELSINKYDWFNTIEYSDNYDEARAKRNIILDDMMEGIKWIKNSL